MLRIGLAVAGALLANLVAVFLVELVSEALFPFPQHLNLHDRTAVAAALARIPFTAKLTELCAWVAGAAAAATVAALVSRQPKMAWVGAAITFLAILWTLNALQHPLWMVIAGVVIPIAVAAIVSGVTEARRRAAAA